MTSSISSLVIWKIRHSGQWCIYRLTHSASELSTNNEREISIPHEAAECGIENFEFIVSERVQVNSDNSRATSALTFLLFKLNTLHKETLH